MHAHFTAPAPMPYSATQSAGPKGATSARISGTSTALASCLAATAWTPVSIFRGVASLHCRSGHSFVPHGRITAVHACIAVLMLFLLGEISMNQRHHQECQCLMVWCFLKPTKNLVKLTFALPPPSCP